MVKAKLSGKAGTDIREQTLEDPQLALLFQYMRSGWPAPQNQTPAAIKMFCSSQHLFTEVEGMILRGNQIVIPVALRSEIINRAHERHLGIAKTKARARDVIWWPGMGVQLENKVSNCDVCAKYRHQQRKEPLLSTPTPKRPWEKVAADIFEWQGHQYLLLVDYYSKFPEVHRLNGMMTSAVVSALKKIFSRYGGPEVLFSDNGPQFVSSEMQGFVSLYGFSQSTSSPRHPQGNGLVERMVQTVKGLLMKSVENGEDFHLALLAYRSTPHESTGFSPAQLLMGRRLRTSLPSSPNYLLPATVAPSQVQRNEADSKENQAINYNRQHGVRQLRKLLVGDHVLIWDGKSKLWKTPAIVRRKLYDRS